jgi:hypothetical protein
MAWITQGQIIRVFFLLLAIGTALAGHLDALPVLFQPYREWFEAAGFIGTIVQGVLVMPPQFAQPTRTEWTAAERQAKAAVTKAEDKADAEQTKREDKS